METRSCDRRDWCGQILEAPRAVDRERQKDGGRLGAWKVWIIYCRISVLLNSLVSRGYRNDTGRVYLTVTWYLNNV